MKTLIKSILVSIPAFVIAATVGLSMVGCGGDDAVSPDLAVKPDQSVAVDMAKKD